MHELSLCRSIASIVERNRQGRDVTRVGIKLGAFRQAIPQTLTYCWQIVTQDTALSGSRLDFEIVPLEIECRDCGRRTQLHEMWLRCPDCASTSVTIVHGEEFMVTTMDLADPPGPQPDPERGPERAQAPAEPNSPASTPLRRDNSTHDN